MPDDCVAPHGSEGCVNTEAAVGGADTDVAEVSKSDARNGGGPFPLDVRLQEHVINVDSYSST